MAPTAVSRRSLFALTAGTVIAAPSILGGTSGDLKFSGFGGEYEEAQAKTLFKPFEKQTGIRVDRLPTQPSIARMAEQLHAGTVNTDLMTLPDRMLRVAIQEKLLQPLDFRTIKARDIPVKLVTDHSVAHSTLAMQLTYSTLAFPSDPPMTWADFWNVERFPGSRALFDGPTYTLEFALLADGVEKEDLYPLDIDRAFRSLARIRPAVTWWWTSFTRPGDLFKYQNLAMSPWTRAVPLIVNYEMPLSVSYQGALLTNENWVVPSHAPNISNAMRFIAWAIEPKQQAAFANQIGWGPTDPRALAFVSPLMKPLLPTSPQQLGKTIEFDAAWWATNARSVGERWFEWRLQG